MRNKSIIKKIVNIHFFPQTIFKQSNWSADFNVSISNDGVSEFMYFLSCDFFVLKAYPNATSCYMWPPVILKLKKSPQNFKYHF